ncbi:MAG: hypothetical protein KJ666_16985 [Bacteroidetes bacterium]|nr:hypothetical protein [Bacteroidota bacterium]MBU2584615.1 hypothetical protein [Bacteroidota bacterium]
MLYYIVSFLLIVSVNESIVFAQKLSKSENDFSLQEKLVIGNKEKNLLLEASSVVQASSGEILVSDKLNYSIKKFDNLGNKIVEVGKRGRANSEFRGPNALDVYKDIIAAADFASSRVQIFTIDFKHLKTFYAPGPIHDLAFDPNGKLWLGVLTDTKGKNLFQYDIDGKQLKHISLKNSKEDVFDNMFSFVISNSGKIAIVYNYFNKIEIWDIHSNFITEYVVEGVIASAKKKTISTGLFSKIDLPLGIVFQDVAVDNKENIFILSSDYSTNQYRDVYVYNTNGKYVYRFTLLAKASQVWINQQGELFTIENKRTIVKKYRLNNFSKK